MSPERIVTVTGSSDYPPSVLCTMLPGETAVSVSADRHADALAVYDWITTALPSATVAILRSMLNDPFYTAPDYDSPELREAMKRQREWLADEGGRS